MAIVIKLMADCSQFPLWRGGGSFDNVGEIDPATLPISVELQTQLRAWHTRYYAQYNLKDFDQSRFFTDEEVAVFDRQGLVLWQQLRRELAPDYEVWYFSESARRVFKHPNELLGVA